MSEDLADGRYKLERELGRGGAAEVWLAFDLELERHVAIKILNRSADRDPSKQARFQHEALAAAQISHPNVVSIYDRGELVDGRSYITMRYVEGETLRARMTRAMSAREAVWIAREILAGAGAAHARGVIHRDLKPQNVLIGDDGIARISDFGIAISDASESLTKPGIVVGSVSYFSPEQARGKRVDHRSDLFSIGVILYEMLTGRNPFTRSDPVSTARQITTADPEPPSSLNPDVTQELDRVIARALAKDPEDRFQTAGEFLAALEAASLASPKASESRRWRRAALVILVVVLAIGAGVATALLTLNQKTTTVPHLIGEQISQARSELSQADLNAEIQRRHSQAPAGQVISQHPSAGSEITKNASVSITVSEGIAHKTVPDLSGMSASDAESQLTQAGLRIGSRSEAFSSEIAAGSVIRTEPEAGESVEPKSVIDLIISKGAPPVRVPDLIGLTQNEAEDELADIGLITDIASSHSSEPVGDVISQSPAAGERLKAGEKVHIVISSGEERIVVGDFTGATLEEAQSSIRSLGLRSSAREVSTETASDDGIIIRQKPTPGKKLRPGATVELFVGRYQPPS